MTFEARDRKAGMSAKDMIEVLEVVPGHVVPKIHTNMRFRPIRIEVTVEDIVPEPRDARE